MDRIVSFLLFAALFYFMMRFGCGSHMIHGHQRHEGHDETEPHAGEPSKDPVCGMEANRVAAIPRSSADTRIDSVPVDVSINSTQTLGSSLTHRRRTG